MKTLLRRITLECYRHPDEQPMPWYAWPLGVLAIATWIGAYVVLGSQGF